MKMVSEEYALVIDQFLAENWSEFEQHCDEHGYDDADEVVKQLQ